MATIDTSNQVIVSQPGETTVSAKGTPTTPRWFRFAADATERAAISPEFLGQLLLQQDDITIWVGTALLPGQWEAGAGTMVAANATERATITPLFLGQLLSQTSDNTMWVADGVTVGDWVRTYTPSYASNISDFLGTSDDVAARAALGVAIGTDVQAWDSFLEGTTASFTSTMSVKLAGIETGADVTDTAGIVAAGGLVASGALGTPSSGSLANCTGLPVVGGGTGATTAAAARIALGLQIGADVQAFDAGNYVAGGTDVAVVDGGTGSSTAGAARIALGLQIGTDVQAYDAGNYVAGGTDVAVADGGTGASTAGAAATNLGLGTGDSPTFAGLTVTAYERHIQVPARLSGTPAAQPTAGTYGTAGGLVFATSGAEYAYIQWEVPDDWDGGDAYIEIDWIPFSAAVTGAVKWDINYRSKAEGEVIDAGTAVTVTVTDSTAHAQGTSVHGRMTLDFDDANQPMTAQDHMFFQVTRDTGVASDFAGTVMITAFEIIYNSTTLPRSN